ncbi:MFS transporter [Pseudonocardia acaciae]|uniref:MFS transporter n=1 Tax=Pseudonocardia acaciae TaxID=551276 RepID=UPI00055A338A|nr:MFS transporter [Pseudonocardia acaciae]
MTADDLNSEPPRAGVREWCGLAVLALPLLVLALDVSVLYLAAPAMSADLGATATQQLWILDVYGFLIAGFLVTMGAVGDRIGRRRLLLAGGAAFAVASVVAAYAPSAGALIAARGLLGVAGATLMPSTLALISTMFRDPAQRTSAVAIWMTTFSAGVAAGPVIGGALLARFWWGSVFLLGVPVMVVLLVLGPRLLPEHRQPGADGGVDAVGVVLSLAAMLPLVYGVKETAAHGPAPVPALAAAVGLVAGWAFVRRQRRSADPLLDVRLFTRRGFVGAVALVLLGLLALNGLYYLLPQFLQLVSGVDPLRAGLWMLPVALATVGGSLLTPPLARRFGRTRLLAAACAVSVIGCLAVTRVGPDVDPPVLVGLLAVTILGVVPTGVLGTDLVLGSVPPERAGSASAVTETAGELGVALGVAVAGSLVAAVYGATLGSTLPTGMPADAAEAAREGLAPALGAAATLPPGAAAALTDAAREAFTTAFTAVGWYAAAVLTVAVVLVVTVLRERASR